MADPKTRSGWLLPPLSPRTYLWTDRVTKLIGVVSVATALQTGIASGVGATLALVGVLLALSTVPIEITEPAESARFADANDGDTHEQD